MARMFVRIILNLQLCWVKSSLKRRVYAFCTCHSPYVQIYFTEGHKKLLRYLYRITIIHYMEYAQRISDDQDRIVARALRLHRVARGMTQPQLARKIGISHQQLQKYETGVNRISAGRLAAIAAVLSIPVHQFFHPGFVAEVEEVETINRRILTLAQQITTITNPRHRDALHVLVRALAE